MSLTVLCGKVTSSKDRRGHCWAKGQVRCLVCRFLRHALPALCPRDQPKVSINKVQYTGRSTYEVDRPWDEAMLSITMLQLQFCHDMRDRYTALQAEKEDLRNLTERNETDNNEMKVARPMHMSYIYRCTAGLVIDAPLLRDKHCGRRSRCLTLISTQR